MKSLQTLAARARSLFRSFLGSKVPAHTRRSTRRQIRIDLLEERRVMTADIFGAVAMVTTGTPGPSDVAMVDINRDGRHDMIVSHSSIDQIQIHLGDGRGGFGQATMVGTGGSIGGAIQVADVTGDGRPDILASNRGLVWLIQQNADGSFARAVSTGVLHGVNKPLEVADLNGDGRLDIVSGYAGGQYGDWFLASHWNNGGGTFTRSQQLDTGSYQTATLELASLDVADVNGDGRADIVLATNDKSLRIFRSNGTGTFQKENLGANSSPGFRSLKLRDVNGDGRPDIIVANELNDTVGVRLNQGNGVFGAATNFSVGDVPVSIAIADFDRDGRLDLLVANRGPTQGTSATGDRLSFLKGNGNGTFQQAVDYLCGSTTDTATQPSDLAFGDFNNDGLLDVIVGHNQAIYFAGNNMSTRVSVLLGTVATGPIDNAGNTTGTARNLGVLAGTQTFQDWVGQRDTNDFYRFEVARRSELTLNMTGLRADIDVELLDANGNRITASTNGGSLSELISRTLDAGTYFIRVYPHGGAESTYSLSVTATPIAQANLRLIDTYLSDQYGNRIDGPRAGMPWFVTVDFETDSIPANSSYTIRQSLDGGNAMQNTVSWAAGTSGRGNYRHIWGAWSGIAAGPHSFTVTLDADNRIAESNETDNFKTVRFVASTGDLAGNTMATARDIGTLNGARVFQDHVFGNDPTDVYRFTLTARSSFSATLSELTANADIELVDQAGRVIAYSRRSGTEAESLVRTLEAGTYFVRVKQGNSSANTFYNLALSALPTHFVR